MYLVHIATFFFLMYHFKVCVHIANFQKASAKQPERDSVKFTYPLTLLPSLSTQSVTAALPPTTLLCPRWKSDTFILQQLFLMLSNSSLQYFFLIEFNHTSANILQTSAAILEMKDIL